MNDIYFYGCSFTACENLVINNDPYFKFKGGKTLPYTEIIANELNKNVVNRSINGGTNDNILHRLILDLGKYTKDDYVIVQLSMFNRFECIIDNNGVEERMGVQYLSYDSFKNMDTAIKEKVFKFIDLIETFGTHIDIERTRNILNTLTYIRENITKNVYIFALDYLSEYNNEKTGLTSFPNFISFDGIPSLTQFQPHKPDVKWTIEAETDGLIPNSHYGEFGNKVMAEYILNFINKTNE